MTQDRQLELLASCQGRRVAVLGDVMLDRFVYGNIDRISPEAPVPVLSATREAAVPGGAANVARNIASLGGCAIVLGIIGQDDAGRELCILLGELKGVEHRLVSVPGHPTTIKIRYIAGSQQIVRVDHEVRSIDASHLETLLAHLFDVLKSADALIVSDYAKGLLTDHVVARAIAWASAAHKPVIVDPKSTNIARYDGASIVTPNLSEAEAATGVRGCDDHAVAAMAHAILDMAPAISAAIITRGADGMSVKERGRQIRHLPVAAREVFDVSGAGDTVAATLGLCAAVGAEFAEAAELANIAAGIVVGKTGTAEVWMEELVAALQSQHLHSTFAKNVTASHASRSVAKWRAQGLQVGFTNGCFDLIHPGHISILNQAKAHCDRLIVGLNTDSSVKRLKGPDRPLQDENARAVVLAAFTAVDLVVLFGEDTPSELIKLLRPDVLVKGMDYTIDKVVGADVVQSYGGRVIRAKLAQGQSTTGIISRMHKGER